MRWGCMSAIYQSKRYEINNLSIDPLHSITIFAVLRGSFPTLRIINLMSQQSEARSREPPIMSCSPLRKLPMAQPQRTAALSAHYPFANGSNRHLQRMAKKRVATAQCRQGAEGFLWAVRVRATGAVPRTFRVRPNIRHHHGCPTLMHRAARTHLARTR